MTDPTPLFSLFGISLYPFGLCVALGALAAAALLCLSYGRAGWPTGEALRFALLCLPCAYLGARLGYCAVRSGFLFVDFGASFLWRVELGGFSLAGASLGLLLAAWVFARRANRPFARALDLAMPAALLALACERVAERFTLAGLGDYVDDALWQRFPFAVPDVYGDWRLPVFAWEALAALALCLLAFVGLRRARRDGDAALWNMALLGATQILLESLRRDDFLRFGFVRVNQLWGVALLLMAALRWLARAKLSRPRRCAALLGYAAGVGALVLVEFALDKSPIGNGWLYAAMALALAAMVVGAARLRALSERRGMHA